MSVLIIVSGSNFCRAENTRHRVGFLTDLSGPGAFWGKPGLIGAELAAKDLAAQGISVEVVPGDSRLDTKTGLSEAQKLLFVDKVDALIAEFSAVTNAVYPSAKNANKIFIGSGAGRKFLDQYPAAFKAYLEFEKGCREVATEWSRRSIKKIGFLKAQFEASEWCEKGIRSVYPEFEIADFTVGQSVASQVLALKTRKVDALILSGLPVDILNCSKELQRLAWKVPVSGPASDIFTPGTLQQYPAVVEGGIGFGYRKLDPGFERRVLEENSRVGEEGLDGAVNAYVMVKTLGLALAACRTGDIGCQIQALSDSRPDKTMGFNGYINRIADFDTLLYEVKDGVLKVLK